MNTQQNDVYQIAEAVVITAAMNDYIVNVAAKYDHDDDQYKITMQFLSMVYKKFKHIAQTKIDVDVYGNFIVKSSRDIRHDFDIN